MTTTKQIKAENIEDLLDQLNDEWYELVDGCYAGNVPTWGPETESVSEQISSSCAEGDIVSWDTRDADPANHMYLRRDWIECHERHQPEHRFYLLTQTEFEARS